MCFDYGWPSGYICRCGYPHYLTYVGYSTIYADDADIRIRMAIPSFDDLEEDKVIKLVALDHNQDNEARDGLGGGEETDGKVVSVQMGT